MISIWKGSPGFGLVSIPVKLYSTVQQSPVDPDGRDHARIKYQLVNENTHKEVLYKKIVKDYKLNDNYIIPENRDVEDAAPEKNKVIEIESFNKLQPPKTKGDNSYDQLTDSLNAKKGA